MKRLIFQAFVVFGLALTIVGCDEDVLQDPTFRQWCGDKLCSWTLEAGTIRRAPTWHRDDYGVEFNDTPTIISQVVVDKNPKCLLFTTVADVDPRAQMTVEIDFNDDGSTDYVWPVPSASWRQVQTLVSAPEAYKGFKFTIKKSGPGRAVLAQMRVQSTDSCNRATAVRLKNLALGETCGDSSECTSGVCCSGTFFVAPVCSTCCDSRLPCKGEGCHGDCAANQRCDKGEKDEDTARSWLTCRTLLDSGQPCRAGTDCASNECIPSTEHKALLPPDGGCAPDASPEECGPEILYGGYVCK